MKNANTIKIIKIALYLLGFPLLAVLAFINALKIYDLGNSYGIMCFVGLIIVVALGGVYALVTWLVQKNKKKSIKNQTIRLVIAAVVLLLGFGIILDVAFPPILDGATDGTIPYEALADDWEGRAEVNHDLLAKWIVLNIANGNISTNTNYYTVKASIDAKTIVAFQKYVSFEVNTLGNIPFEDSGAFTAKNTAAEYDAMVENLSDDDKLMFDLINDNYLPFDFDTAYNTKIVRTGFALAFTNCLSVINADLQKQGVKNELVATTLKNNYQSMDKMGYKTFSSTALPYANSSRLTIPVLVHLILDPREECEYVKENGTVLYWLYNPTTGVVEKVDLDWTILDIDGKVMTVPITIEDLSEVSLLGMTIQDLISSGLLDSTFTALHEFVADDNLAGAPLEIYLAVDGDNLIITIRPSNTVRGVLGYQNQAWLDSNSLVFMLCSVFSVRKLVFIFAGVLVLLTLVIGLLREKEAELKANAPAEEAVKAIDANEASDPTTDEVVSAIEEIPTSSTFADEEVPEALIFEPAEEKTAK